MAVDAPYPSGRLTVVGIGASAGGLDAATRFVQAVPADSGMAFILVQHLEPNHESMMAELLARHTAMPVVEASEGAAIEAEHLYVIPPGRYLSVGGGVLHLSVPPARHGLRAPFDFLLASMAEAYGERAACVVLSGTGTDGSKGVLAIKGAGGLVAVQDPAEAEYDGMPRCAIESDAAAIVLGVADIPAALMQQRGDGEAAAPGERPAQAVVDGAADGAGLLPQFVELLRIGTVHDFSQYKSGTLQRRIEQRMVMADARRDMAGYLERLRTDEPERDRLAKDLLINVTGFFRDAEVFERLAGEVIPALVANHPAERPLRVWVAGCSTGEETYSLAMLLLEEIAAAKRPIKLQVFASDVDAEAVAAARDGRYPVTIEACVTPERLARFFTRTEAGWQATADLRATIVFAVHDVLSDPPFCRLDLMSCRNLLIYLLPDAQARVIDTFHFALRQDGLLLLGSAETVGEAAKAQFEVVAKDERIYRRIGRDRSPRVEQLMAGAALRLRDVQVRPNRGPAPERPSRRAVLAELGRRLVLDSYAPAAILVDAADQMLFSIGPTARYVQLPTGHATHDLVAVARPELRVALRAAMQEARETDAKVLVRDLVGGEGHGPPFSIEIHPVEEMGEAMLLVCFVELPERTAAVPGLAESGRAAALGRELEAVRKELRRTVQTLELSGEEQRVVNEEALSVNEEYQSTNEELLASKEELQSLNEELTALNSQLQETLERQRTTANDLQHVLFSTNVATLFLDLELRIRFFTPAIRSLFDLVPSDVGRKLSAFAALAPDGSWDGDVQTVLAGLEPVEREIGARDGAWFRRRILPYRGQGGRVEGVVVTFDDITARKTVAEALEAAKRSAEAANAAKSSFLASASHDLRQPLQTLALLQALLARAVEGEKAQALVVRLDDTLAAMTVMLDALLDISEIEAGAVRAELAPFAIGGLLERLGSEFGCHAEAKGLGLRVAPCSLLVLSDARLLEQMVRNLLSNALKYTTEGRVLVGCRRRGSVLTVEVWDTGIGIADTELGPIFKEYHQVGNAARERSKGLGLGLSIVKRLGEMLGHPIRVRSQRGKGSCFSIEVRLAPGGAVPQGAAGRDGTVRAAVKVGIANRGRIVVVEDDPDVRELLRQVLDEDGHQVVVAADGPAALGLLAQFTPDLLLADYNLPNGPNGLELAGRVRRALRRAVPAVILTGDIAAETLRAAEAEGCVPLGKPIKPSELTGTIDRLLAPARRPAVPPSAAVPGAPTVFVVDDEAGVRAAIAAILADAGWAVAEFTSSEAFLDGYRPGSEACLLIDAGLPGLDGIDLVEKLRGSGDGLPAIIITGNSDVGMAVHAMKAGASDFIEKPIGRTELLACIGRAMEQSRDWSKRTAWRDAAAATLAALTPRQREIMSMVLAGQPSKNIAADLGISQRTVENHRASIMHRTGSASLPALARLALAAAAGDGVRA